MTSRLHSLENSAGAALADVLLSSWRERGGIAVRDGSELSVHRQGILGPFLLDASDGSEVARATKPSAFRREFLVEHGGQRYIQELKRIEAQVRRPVRPAMPQREPDRPPGTAPVQPLLRQRRPQGIPTQPLQSIAVTGSHQ
jgi:hypothetical protein